ncbi:MAG TPA: ABC transporter permease [Candidatus Solibacter sp.]|nr:ABC transporter permease [Candidatus Solibacter sp.]
MSDWKEYVRERLPELGLPGPRQAEIVEELAQQLEQAHSEALAKGASEAEASARAAGTIPDWAALAAEIRRAERPLQPGLPEPEPERGVRRIFAEIWQDVNYGARLFGRTPGFAAVLVLTLALGIGANSMMFTVVNAVLLRPLPYPDPARLVLLNDFNHEKGFDSFSVAPGNFLDWRAQSHSFEHMATFGGSSFSYTGGTYPERLRGLRVTDGFFQGVGVKPVLGRIFEPGEFTIGQEHEVIISYGLWQKVFQGDASAIGRTIRLNDEPYTVVGVMPAGFRFISREQDVIIPGAWPPEWRDVRGAHFLSVVARLKAGVTLEQSRQEMAAIAQHLAEQYPDMDRGWGIHVDSLYESVVGEVRPALLLLLGAVAVLLLIACGNVANMLLARTVERRRELAVRASLGAAKGRLVRQMLAESLLLSLAGGGLGLLLAASGTRAILALLPDVLPRAYSVHVDPWVLGFTFGIAVLTGIGFGLAPVLSIARQDLQDILREGGRTVGGGYRMRGALVAVEVSLALVLLIGAGLLLGSFERLEAVAPGFRAEHALTFDVNLPRARYGDPVRQAAFYHDLRERLLALPGVEAAAAVTPLPLGGDDMGFIFEVENSPPEAGREPSAEYYQVTPGYFQTMGIPMVAGREFTDRDAIGAPRVCIINDVLARQYFAGQNPIGRRLFLGAGQGHVYREIVGVASWVKHYWLGEKPSPQAYEPIEQYTDSSASFVVRASLDPASLSSAVRGAVKSQDSELPIGPVHTMDQVVADSVAMPRFRTVLLLLFAGFAVALAVVGLYGVMSYTVTQRTREIGIRMVLGAQRRSVYRLVVGQGMLLVGAGLVAGLLAALGLARLLQRFLFGVTATDPLTFLAVSFLLAAVAACACFSPAYRASRVDPLVSIRYE